MTHIKSVRVHFGTLFPLVFYAVSSTSKGMLFDTRAYQQGSPNNMLKGMVRGMRTFGETLALLREEKGLSLNELAGALSISSKALQKIERGDREPTILELVTVGNYFNVSYDYMLGRIDSRIAAKFLDQAQGNERLASILQLLSNLPEDRIEAISLVLKDMDVSAFVRKQLEKD